jgi:hypothetical protein
LLHPNRHPTQKESTMNKFILALIATSAVAGAAQAQEVTIVQPMSQPSVDVSRAMVQAQAVAALRAGTIEFGEASRPAEIAMSTGVTRAQVHAETVEAARRGLLDGGEVTVLPSATDLAAITAAGQRVAGQVIAAG